MSFNGSVAMEIIQWKDEYSVGVAKLDGQHKRLFNIINKLIGHPGSSADITLISQTLKEMVNYAKEHFTDEEELMQKYGFAELEQQRKQHAYFVNTTTELALNVLNDGQKTGDEIAEFLRTWLTIHILKWDMKYKEFFKSKMHAAAASAV
jgi:hemerythrin-like metal-binding protein